MSVSCHFMRGAMLELNGLFSRDFAGKFENFSNYFPEQLTKETFRRRLEDLTKFVKTKSACVGDSRKLYVKKYGIEAWNNLSSEEKREHSLKCKFCLPDTLFREPTGFRTKKNTNKKLITPVKKTPLKRATREQMKTFSDQVVSTGMVCVDRYLFNRALI